MVFLQPKSVVKCKVVGDGMVGKTCLTRVVTGLPYPRDYVSTVKNELFTNISLYGIKYIINMTDVSEETTEGINDRCDDVTVVCYSVVDRESFQSVRCYWSCQVQFTPIILVGTQTDLRQESNTSHVTEKEGRLLAEQIGAWNFLECSAVTKIGTKEVLNSVINVTIKRRRRKKSLIKRVFGK